MDGLVDDMRLEVRKLSKFYKQTVQERSPPILPTGFPSAVAGTSASLPSPPATGVFPSQSQVLRCSSVPERPSASGGADRPSGHSIDYYHREDGFGSVTTVVHPPVKGACRLPTPPISPKPAKFYTPDTGMSGRSAYVGSSGAIGRLPKLKFPSFDGENPKLWLSRSVDFLEMYEVEPHKWIKIATMHFLDPAACWLPSVEFKLQSCSWATFESMVLDKFGRDQHALLVRQLFHIKQTHSVEEYVDKFAGLVDQLAAYENKPDPLHYTMHFIDGLRDDIRAAVLIQHPTELDTAFALAKLQEEVSTPYKRRDSRKSDYNYQYKQDIPAVLGFSKADKLSTTTEDRRSTEASRTRSVEERWLDIKAHRRSQGLCQRCAEKWTKDHRCAEKVQLNVLQEILEMFPHEEFADEAHESSVQDQLFLTVSEAAVSGASTPRTMCLSGAIHDQAIPVRILVKTREVLIHL